MSEPHEPRRRPLIAANWKMNGLRADSAARFQFLLDRIADAAARPECDIVVCPPATLIGEMAALAAGSAVGIGGQDCHFETSGAFTGDIAAPMLADLGATFVIVGHSERRDGHGESDALVARKARAAQDAGLTAIVCVGESRKEREAGWAEQVISAQIEASIPENIDPDRLVIAYEPIWAIGTGLTAEPDAVDAMHCTIRERLKARVPAGESVRVLYGGSVTPDNAARILGAEHVDGALVGGASLDGKKFWQILRSCP